MINVLIRMIFSPQDNSVFGQAFRVFMQQVKYPILYVMQSTKNIRVKLEFIDLKKTLTFDPLDHSQLLNKSSNYGFRGPIFHLMGDYLTNRWQCVFDKDRIIKKLSVITDVPQGSIIEIFLFLVSLKDLPAVCSTKSISQ